jgi:hypothetical protein
MNVLGAKKHPIWLRRTRRGELASPEQTSRRSRRANAAISACRAQKRRSLHIRPWFLNGLGNNASPKKTAEYSSNRMTLPAERFWPQHRCRKSPCRA